MKKHFYSHLIEIDTVITTLDVLELSPDEKNELQFIVESTIHHVVVDTVLSELSEEDKKTFLAHMTHEKHDDLWSLLKQKVENVEDKIKTVVEKMKQELHADIHETKKEL